MLRLDINFLLTMINLIVLCFLLKRFLIGPILRIMEQRQSMISEGLQNAQEEQEKAKALKMQYEDALGKAKGESLQIVEKARLHGKQEYERIVGEAGEEAGKMLNDARAIMDVEREQTMREMKTKVAGLAMDAARKIAVREISDGDSQDVYDQFLKDAGDFHDDNEEDR